MDKQFYINRRNKFFEKFPNKSLALLHSGINQFMSLDGEYPFEVDRNFYYFTGIASPNVKLLFVKTKDMKKAILCIPRIDQVLEKWIGKFLTKDDCKSVSGIDEIIYLDEMDDLIHSHILASRIDKCFLYIDEIQKGRPQTLNNLTYFDITKRYPLLEIKNLAVITKPMRMIKTEEEIDMIKASCKITKAAIEEAVKNIKPSVHEYEIQACFEYVVKRRGGKIAFNTIAASGDNAITLHYTSNQCKMKDDEMLLLDCGASLNWYNSDVTRTFPVNGKFSERQLQIYNIVLKANQKIIHSVRPGVTLKELNDIVIELYAQELKAIGLISEDKEVSDYYYHGVSHSLGLDTHDVFDKNIPLEPNMVITVEPGLYIEKYGIGIRIEDDVRVTEKGCEVLTDILKDPVEIEECMDVWEVK